MIELLRFTSEICKRAHAATFGDELAMSLGSCRDRGEAMSLVRGMVEALLNRIESERALLMQPGHVIESVASCVSAASTVARAELPALDARLRAKQESLLRDFEARFVEALQAVLAPTPAAVRAALRNAGFARALKVTDVSLKKGHSALSGLRGELYESALVMLVAEAGLFLSEIERAHPVLAGSLSRLSSAPLRMPEGCIPRAPRIAGTALGRLVARGTRRRGASQSLLEEGLVRAKRALVESVFDELQARVEKSRVALLELLQQRIDEFERAAERRRAHALAVQQGGAAALAEETARLAAVREQVLGVTGHFARVLGSATLPVAAAEPTPVLRPSNRSAA